MAAARGKRTCPSVVLVSGARGEGETRVSSGFRGRDLYIEVEGARKLQMRYGFRPRGRDRTLYMMERVLVGFGPTWRGVGLQHT